MRGRKLEPTTAADPLLRQIFTEQERLGVTTYRLARLAGMSPKIVATLRHPEHDKGKRVLVHHIRQLAFVLDFEWPEKLVKR